MMLIVLSDMESSYSSCKISGFWRDGKRNVEKSADVEGERGVEGGIGGSVEGGVGGSGSCDEDLVLASL